jgi:hypothetical protein
MFLVELPTLLLRFPGSSIVLNGTSYHDAASLGGATMVIGTQYFLRHAAALLAAAQQAADPREVTELIQQAADLITMLDEMISPDDPAELH